MLTRLSWPNPSLHCTPVSEIHNVDVAPDPPTRTPPLVRDPLTLDPITVTLVPPVFGPFVLTALLTAIDENPSYVAAPDIDALVEVLPCR